jgi:hypothetical protein
MVNSTRTFVADVYALDALGMSAFATDGETRFGPITYGGVATLVVYLGVEVIKPGARSLRNRRSTHRPTWPRRGRPLVVVVG